MPKYVINGSYITTFEKTIEANSLEEVVKKINSWNHEDVIKFNKVEKGNICINGFYKKKDAEN